MVRNIKLALRARTQVYLKHVIQDSLPAILRLRPPEYENRAIDTLLEITSQKLRVLIEKFVPKGLLLWKGKRSDAKTAHEILKLILFNSIETEDENHRTYYALTHLSISHKRTTDILEQHRYGG